MAEEEVVVVTPTLVPSSDLKRKLEDLDDGDEGKRIEASVETCIDKEDIDAKRAKFDINEEASKIGNDDGVSDAERNEDEKLNSDGNENLKQEVENQEVHDLEKATNEFNAVECPLDDNVKDPENGSIKILETEAPEKIMENSKDSIISNDDTKGSSQEEDEPIDDDKIISRKVEIPNDKVGVLIGKGGETIRYIQFNADAKIQILRDAEADLHSVNRPVEIVGKMSSIARAKKLIDAVIAEADAGGSPALVARGLSSGQTTGPGEQIEMQVPNDKVGLIIGRRGENIKNLQARSGARIQLIPQHLPEGDGSKDRTVRLTGDRRQIKTAREMILDVMNQTVRGSSGPYNQQPSYGPPGHGGPPYWHQRGPPSQPMHYDYPPRSNSHYGPPNYGNYPMQHIPSRGSMGPGWDPRPHPPFSQGAPFDYYGARVPPPGPSGSSMAPPPYQTNYGYGQSHGSEYAHQAPYGHQGYGGSQPGYAAQQQYGGKQPSYSQPYGPPRGNQPGDMSYGGVHQQQYSYPPYPQGASTDAYNQAVPTAGPAYQNSSVAAYGQPGGQPAASGYLQSSSTGYGQYPLTQQTYGDQSAYQNQDTSYAANPYNSQASYAQPAAGTQATLQGAGYDHSVAQQTGVAANAAVQAQAQAQAQVQPQTQPVYGYDSAQAYAAPH